jgi:hypothetical protein
VKPHMVNIWSRSRTSASNASAAIAATAAAIFCGTQNDNRYVRNWRQQSTMTLHKYTSWSEPVTTLCRLWPWESHTGCPGDQAGASANTCSFHRSQWDTRVHESTHDQQHSPMTVANH